MKSEMGRRLLALVLKAASITDGLGQLNSHIRFATLEMQGSMGGLGIIGMLAIHRTIPVAS